MLGASLFPARFRSSGNQDGYLSKKLAPVLQTLSQPACQHPIRTIVFILVLASSSYIGLLEGSLSEAAKSVDGPGSVDLPSLVDKGIQLKVGPETSWKWQADTRSISEIDSETNHLALLTLVFPNSLSHTSPQTAPDVDSLPIPEHASVKSLPSTSNPFAPISQDSSLAYSMPWSQVAAFLNGIQEIPEHKMDLDTKRVWVTRASKSTRKHASWRGWILNAWSEFVDLLKHAEMLDIIIMSLGYLSMHLTFVSLFMSMRKLGSNFWLATTVLFSSVFSFLFGLVVTTKLGVPINMVLLSEGLPFLVVTIGFEKSIVLTKAVLSASVGGRHQGKPRSSTSIPDNGPRTIQDAVSFAVREKGFEIVRDYLIEIAILIAGAASGVQGGLRQFCFLAAWILLFDGILLFTFYTAILCVKLEINRIKRHVALRRALEEDGVSRRVAENVASSNEWPKAEKRGNSSELPSESYFGKTFGDHSIPKFKFLLFGGFILLNVINICTIPFRSGNKNAQSPTLSGIQGVVNSPPIDPFKVAENGLDYIHAISQKGQLPTVVTVLAPVKYELRSAFTPEDDEPSFESDYADHLIDVMGGRVIEGVLKSLEDPVLSKWIIVALTISLILNGYLFNAARWSIKEPRSHLADDAVQKRPVLPAPVEPEAGVNGIIPNGVPVINGHIAEPEPTVTAGVDGEPATERTKEECEKMIKDGKAAMLNDRELLGLTVSGKIPGYALEKTLENTKVMTRLESLTRAVKIRRGLVSRTPGTSETTYGLETSKLPYKDYNYENVHGACCENVIGYMPLPVGVAGPIIVDGQPFYLPLATTEGVLVASTNRGCKAINAGGGATTVITGDGMTRGPCVAFETLARAGQAKVWLDSADGQRAMKESFNSTSRFARLQSMKTALAGTYLYIRFKTTTGDAMGMNMISKGVECALKFMTNEAGFDDMSVISVSGNYCTDKKSAAVNWIDGRGKSVCAEAIIPGDVIRKVLKSDVDALVELNTSKNLIGSAMAGSIGGFNAHAANLVAAMYLATGQDPAQVVESSSCITIMKNYNGNLQISVSMPCIEVGTIGGGTVLEPQRAMLDMLGVKGAHPTNPGDNARKLARIICASVLAGELSLCSALAAGHLVQAHMAHNRSAVPSRAPTPIQSAVQAAPSKGQLGEGLSMTGRR